MATTLEELVFKFEADLSSLKAGLTSAQASVDRLEKGVKKSADKMGAALGGMGRLFKLDLLIRYGQQLISIEDRMEILASTIKDTSDRADIGAEALQKLRHVADQNGTSAEAMDSALIRLNKAMGLARLGAEGMREIFQKMGLGKLIEQGASTEEMFYAIADSVSKFKDESKASAVVAKIMGREADRLIETFKLGGPEAKRLANTLRGVIPQETINKLDAARDRTEEYKKTMNAMGAGAADVFTDLVIWVGRTATAMDNALSIAKSWKDTMFGLGLVVAAYGPDWMQGSSSASQSSERKNASAKHGVRGKSFNFALGGLPSGAADPDELGLGTLLGGDQGTKEAAEDAEHYAEVLADLKFQIDQLSMSEQAAAQAQDLRNALSSAGVKLDSERGQAIAKLVEQLKAERDVQDQLNAAAQVDAANANREIADMHDKMREMSEKWAQVRKQIEGDMASGFVDMAFNMKNAREILAGLIEDIGKLIAKTLMLQAIQGVTDAIIGAPVGGRAMGGLVNAGNPYMVGESGPELFVPRASGQIVPRGSVGGTSIVLHTRINAGAGVNRAELEMMLDRRDRNHARQVEGIVKNGHARGRLRLA